MTNQDARNRLSEIIDEMNDLCADSEEIERYCYIDCIIDDREDEGLPPFTPEELKAAEEECDRRLAEVMAIEEKIDKLDYEYREIADKYGFSTYPKYNSWSQRYDEGWNFCWGS